MKKNLLDWEEFDKVEPEERWDQLLEDDEISPEEEEFMRGYDEAR